ncbi:Aldose 1-epimerase subfamily [Coleofasciculus chthonoplastes PCC 7420]|uniref:Aldose 1-epimerase subfamily n=1 Tax=Coleofasciculus chthonoplastes PCC 7420 TaxID=118168 RepID=B4VXU1_9CYAN|nr:aldose 1-epimerase [Coleofasciculus chthonoplastes]EDX73188.1 Aldose 1-epimerase subfamily [Coleofasciculus chthonoplastes PCC 7420]
MFAIALKQEQYSTYILTAQDTQSRLEVVPERGGLISHWSVQGQDILYFDAERFRDPTLSVRGGIPILFPICGNLPDNTYTHQGKPYQLKQHGFARDLPWQVTERVTNDLVSLTLVLNSNDQTRAVYPFDWQLTFTYQLQFEIPAAEYQDQLTGQVSSFKGGFDWSEDEIDVAFRQVTDQSATVTDQQRRLKLTLSYDELYSTLVFWTVKGKDYYCLEPWSAPRNALNTGENLTKLAPGESLETSVQLNVTFF